MTWLKSERLRNHGLRDNDRAIAPAYRRAAMPGSCGRDPAGGMEDIRRVYHNREVKFAAQSCMQRPRTA